MNDRPVFRLTVLAGLISSMIGAAQAAEPGAVSPPPSPLNQQRQSPSQIINPVDDMGVGQLKPPASTDTEFRPKQTKEKKEDSGFKLGSFLVYPEVDLTTVYDNNIYGVDGSVPDANGVIQPETSDTVGIVSPSVAVRSDWKRHELNFNAGADLARYSDHSSENYNDYWINTNGRYDLSTTTNFFGGAGYSREHEDRTSPEGAYGTEPTLFDNLQVHGGIDHHFGNVELRFGGTVQHLNYLNTPTDALPGTTAYKYTQNDDRDRNVYALGSRLSLKNNDNLFTFAQLSLDERRYRNTPDDFGYDRNSHGYRAAVGARFRYHKDLTAEIYGGVLRQNFNDARFSAVTAPDFGGELTWKVSPFTTVRGNLERSLEETIIPGSSSYLYSHVDFRAEHRLTPKTTLSAMVSYGRADYQDYFRKDNLYSGGLGIEYQLTPWLLLQLDYRHFQRDSNDHYIANAPNVDLLAGNYYRDQVYLRLKGLLYPIRNAVTDSSDSFSGLGNEVSSSGIGRGFYAGVQAGYGGLISSTSGPRGSHGGDEGDMGASGGAAGGFLGWGTTFGNRWYGGIEVDGGKSSADFSHSKDKSDSRTFSVEQNSSWGVSLRGGRVLANGALLYGHVGPVWTKFHTYYQTNDAVANAANQDDRLRGKRAGIGVDVPAGEHLFWRMDYSYTKYNAYDVVYDTVPNSTETFNNTGNVFMVGLGWRFAGQAYKPVDPTNGHVGGLYAGGQIGETQLKTHLNAIQTDQGVGPYTLNADFSNNGLDTGLFVGYGWRLNKLYLGVEGGFDTSSASWYHDRTTQGGGGRDFSLEKKGDQTLAARIGYVLDNGTLLYARIGKARTQFNYRYVKGGNSKNYVNLDEKTTGNQFGIGADVPVTPRVFVRFDYSYIDYGDFGFTTTQASADQVKYTNSASLFRLGAGYRF